MKGLRGFAMMMGIGGIVSGWMAPALAVGSSGTENSALSARGLARANAVTADPEDGSTIAYNPAGMTRIRQKEVYAGTAMILTNLEYDGSFEGRSTESDSQALAPIPYLYYTTDLPIENLYLGIGANTPFGLITKYSSMGHFRFISHYNEIVVKGYNLSLAYEIAPSLSVGGGWTYADTSLKQVGKFNAPALTGDPITPDYEFDVAGHAQSWNVGLLFDVTDKDTIGFMYRSELRSHLKGEMSTHGLGVGTTIGAIFGGPSNVTSADQDLTFPSSATLAWNHDFNDRWDIEFDLNWTGWSSIDYQHNVFGTSNAVLAGFETINRDWVDTWNYHLGSSYRFDSKTELSAGYFYYPMAVSKANYTNEVPDGNRHGLSIGVAHDFGGWTIDFGYTAVILEEVSIENTAGNGNGTDIDGDYSGFASVWTTGLRRSF